MSSLIGSKFGNYELKHLLGQGRFASVYLCDHTYFRKPVAIKVFHEKMTGDEVQYFLSMSHKIAQLDHPNILRVLDCGIKGSFPFIVMAYAPRGSLGQCYPRGSRMPPAEIILYIQQIAEALQHCHNQEILHCNIKPENLLLGSDNEVLVTDFGMALEKQYANYQNTQDWENMVPYVAPEQIIGKPVPASDQYTLGIVVYEWLCGATPFKGTYTAVCDQHMFAIPPSLCKKIPGLSPAIEAVVFKALSKNPQERFKSINAFAVALAHAYALELPVVDELISEIPSYALVPIADLEKASTPPITFEPKWLSSTHLSRRAVLAGLLACGVAGGSIATFIATYIVGGRTSSTPSRSFASGSYVANSTSLYFSEVITFSGDFGVSEPVNPKGLAYDQTLNRILVTLSPYTTPNGRRVQILNTIISDGTRSSFAPGYATFRDVESMICIVPTNGPPVDHGFAPGDVFVGRGPGDEISRLSSNGHVLSDVWANPGTEDGLWGGLTFDTVGKFGGRLLAATMEGKVFAIDADGKSMPLKDVGQEVGRGKKQRFEGIIVAPTSFGPHAGNLLLGIEGVDDNDPQSGKIYALSSTGEVALLTDIGYAAECITFVPPDGGTYYQTELNFDGQQENRLLAVSASQFLNRLGRMIVVSEYTGELWETTWTGSQYSTARIGRVPDLWSTEGISKQRTELEAGVFAALPPTFPSWSNWSLVPGDFATSVALTSSADINGDLHLLAVGDYDHLPYINTLSGLSHTWTGWKEIAPGGLSTSYSLASVEHDNTVYGFAIRDDSAVTYKPLFINGGPLTTDSWIELPGNLRGIEAVSATVANGRLVLSAWGINQHIYLNELAPGGRADWSGWYNVSGITSSVGCKLTTFQDELYMLVNDLSSGSIFVCARMGNDQWTNWAILPGGEKKSTSISAIAASGQLFIFARGEDQAPYWNAASSTGTWSLWHAFPNEGTTNGELSGVAINSRIYLVGKGTHNNRFYIKHSLP